jgi:hypothetical protein
MKISFLLSTVCQKVLNFNWISEHEKLLQRLQQCKGLHCFFVILKERKNDSIEKQTSMYCSNKPNPVQTYRKYPNKVKPRPAQPSLQYENLV